MNALDIGGALLSAVLAYQCLVFGWLLLLRKAGYYKALHLVDYARIWWVSYIYRYVPGKVLLLVERARMGAAVGIPPAAGAAITIVETLLAILAGSAMSLLAVAYYAGFDESVVIGVAVLMVGAIFLLPLAYRMFCTVPIVERRYPELATVALRSRDILVTVIPYLIHYLLLGTSFFLLSRSLDLFTWSDLPGLCGIYALSHVISLIAVIAPGGLGVREGAFAVQLSRVVPVGIAEALAIGIRVWFTLIELVCYFVVLVSCPALPGDKRAERAS